MPERPDVPTDLIITFQCCAKTETARLAVEPAADNEHAVAVVCFCATPQHTAAIGRIGCLGGEALEFGWSHG